MYSFIFIVVKLFSLLIEAKSWHCLKKSKYTGLTKAERNIPITCKADRKVAAYHDS